MAFKGMAYYQKFFRRKGLKPVHATQRLKRCLTTLDLVIFGTGNMLGAGLYIVTGEVIRSYAGPSAILSFVIAGTIAFFSALCYAELAALLQISGSAYYYVYVALGEFPAFLVGWNLILECLIGAACAASSWSAYLNELVDAKIGNYTVEYLLDGEPWDSNILLPYPDIVAGIVSLLASMLTAIGAKATLRCNVVFVIVNILVVVGISVVGFQNGIVDNLTQPDGFFAYGVLGVLSGSGFCFYSFSGFDALSIAVEETENPAKSVPVATIISMSVTTVTAVISCLSLTVLRPYFNVDPAWSFLEAFETLNNSYISYALLICVLTGISALVVAHLFTMPRIALSMARHGLLFSCLATISQRTGTPVVTIGLFGIIPAALSIFIRFDVLIELLSIGIFVAHIAVVCSVIVLRNEKLDLATEQLEETLPLKRTTLSYRGGLRIRTESETEADLLKNKEEDDDDVDSNPGYKPVEVVNSWTYMLDTTSINTWLLLFIIFNTAATAILINLPSKVKYPLLFWSMVAVGSIVFVIGLICFLSVSRAKGETNKRNFKVPGMPYLPGIVITLELLLMVNLKALAWLRLFVWSIIGKNYLIIALSISTF
ncbi:cationic amino acid transporter 4-like [Anneissia japonica]|uniref:cationic amino acid transporter 4-like n=1 Tax=Anneissia japonica TaxID=1529436 RepID=UPI0014255CD3|nr:cationic amino acid transporter 4-like [Anneissia japonica]